MPSVSEIMTPDVLGLDPATSLVDAARRMNERRVGAVVVTEGDRLVGIVTERDVLRAVATGSVDGPVADAMTHSPETIGPDETAGHAAARLEFPGWPLRLHDKWMHGTGHRHDHVPDRVRIGRELLEIRHDARSARRALVRDRVGTIAIAVWPRRELRAERRSGGR